MAVGQNNCYCCKINYIGFGANGADTRSVPYKGKFQMKNIAMAALAVIITSSCLSGCASITKGTTQSIGITTPPITAALCNLTSSQGSWSVLTPGNVTVGKSKDSITIRCNKDGWQEGFGTIASSFQAMTVGNVFAGGVIGLGVDAATGAMNEYPSDFSVPMVQLPPPSSKATPNNATELSVGK